MSNGRVDSSETLEAGLGAAGSKDLTIGLLGADGAGRSTLLVALSRAMAARFGGHAITIEQVNHPPLVPIWESQVPEFRARVFRLTIDTPGRRYHFIDCPTHKDWEKLLIGQGLRLDGAIMVHSVHHPPYGTVNDQLRGALDLTRVLVWLSDEDWQWNASLADGFQVGRALIRLNPNLLGRNQPRWSPSPEQLQNRMFPPGAWDHWAQAKQNELQDNVDMARLDALDLLDRNSLEPAGGTEFISGSCPEALAGDTGAIACVEAFCDRLQTAFEPIPRPDNLRMLVETVMNVPGRGTLVSGWIEGGSARLGEEIHILGARGNRKGYLYEIADPPGQRSRVTQGERVRLLIGGIVENAPERGDVLVSRDSAMEVTTAFHGNIYQLEANDGGRSGPLHPGPGQIRLHGVDHPIQLLFPYGMEYLMPGHWSSCIIRSQRPVALECGLQFGISEGSRMVAVGHVLATRE